MKPIGYDDAREERDTCITSLDEELRDAWRQFLQKQRTQPMFRDSDMRPHGIQRAKTLLEPINPSVAQLHRYIIIADHVIDGWNFGLFLSAAYQLSGEKEICYDLITPSISNIGYGLRDTHLIIDGEIGINAGHMMTGALTINGIVGTWPGVDMIGTLTCNGSIRSPHRSSFGDRMVGYIENKTATVSGYQSMIGYNGEDWNIRAEDRAQFLHDITNPDRLSHTPLHARLLRGYGYKLIRRRR